MPADREPFFKADEWKALVVFRPHEWRGRWGAEVKLVIALLAVLGGCGLYEVARGDTRVGWNLIAVVAGLLLVLFVLGPLLYVMVAAVRWVFRVIGVTEWWRRVRTTVLAVGTLLFWVAVAGWILIGMWPYLSTSPTKSWYAFREGVPVERVEVTKEPHDCEFATAPLGAKHCHYESKVEVFNPDGNKWLLVTYDKVEE